MNLFLFRFRALSVTFVQNTATNRTKRIFDDLKIIITEKLVLI